MSHLAQDWQPEDLQGFVSEELELSELQAASQRMIDRKTSGRILVKIS